MAQIVEYQGDSTIAVDGVFIELLNEAFWSPGDWYVEVTAELSPYPHPWDTENNECPECGSTSGDGACPSHPDYPDTEGMSWGELADIDGERQTVQVKGRLIDFERNEQTAAIRSSGLGPSGCWVTIHPYDVDAEKYTGDPMRIDTAQISKLVIP